MSIENLEHEYLDWMYNIVCDENYKRIQYRYLFRYLYDTDFDYLMPMDGNRAEEGINLRYRFGRENGYSDAIIASYLDVKDCSVLEMMIALAIRCEEQIMDNDEYGNRVGQWFWEMVVCLGLGDMTDDEFNPSKVGHRLYIFINRLYEKNGRGGLFEVNDPSIDMRSYDIWYQMNFHLREIFGGL